ncbi:MAG: lysophospholipid acyltransferase family protein [Desulfobacca sp.]|nr:lysophospholipid acyltransferase family protein [Desulfobacca sp.]
MALASLPPRNQLSARFYHLSRRLAAFTFGRLYRLEVSGHNNWLPSGPAILCPKHQRWEDIPVVGLAFPKPLYYIAKVELFRHPLLRRLMLALGGVPIDRIRPQATLSSFRYAERLLHQRQHLVLFPEGTYVKHGVGPGKHRLIQLLLRIQNRDGLPPLAFLPVGISYQPQTPGYKVRVQLGPPVYAPGPAQAPELTQTLMDQIGRLSD